MPTVWAPKPCLFTFIHCFLLRHFIFNVIQIFLRPHSSSALAYKVIYVRMLPSKDSGVEGLWAWSSAVHLCVKLCVHVCVYAYVHACKNEQECSQIFLDWDLWQERLTSPILLQILLGDCLLTETFPDYSIVPSFLSRCNLKWHVLLRHSQHLNNFFCLQK